MKKLLKLVSIVQAARHGYAARPHKPWKRKKWQGGGHDAYRYGPTSDPYASYGHRRPRGLKGMLVEAVVSRLLRR